MTISGGMIGSVSGSRVGNTGCSLGTGEGWIFGREGSSGGARCGYSGT